MVKGHWVKCDRRLVEKRLANDGKWYDYLDYFTHYHGNEGTKGKWNATIKERRIANDKTAYTIHEFYDFYAAKEGDDGVLSRWNNSWPEQRQANDGKWYAWDQ